MQRDSNSQICAHANSRISNSFLGTACGAERQAGSDRAVIKQSCTNTSLFLCGLLGIVCLSWRPVFIKQKKSPNKIRSHLDRKRSLLLPGIQTVEILPHIVNHPLTRGLHKKPVSLTSLLKPTPGIYCTSVQLKGVIQRGNKDLWYLDVAPNLSRHV